MSRVPADRTGGRVLGRDVPRVRSGAGIGADACLRIRWISEERISGTGDMSVSAECPAVQECARRYDLDVRYVNRHGAGRGISRTRKLLDQDANCLFCLVFLFVDTPIGRRGWLGSV